MRFAQRFGPLLIAAAFVAVTLRIITSQAAGDSPDAFAIDVDTAGNTATSLGPWDYCRQVSPGNSVAVDVTVTNIPAAMPMIGYNFALFYDASAMSVTGEDQNFLLNSLAGSNLVPGLSDAVPDTDGKFIGTGGDIGDRLTTSESGSGVLHRLTITIGDSAAPGVYPLTFEAGEQAVIGTDGNGRAPDTEFTAALAVGTACPPAPTPTPSPTPCVTNCPTPTPSPSPTPTPVPFKRGDVDCSGGDPNSVDALKVLRKVAGLSVQQGPGCTPIGDMLPIGKAQGDINCDGNVNAVDALFILRFVAGLNVNLPGGCPPVA